MQHPILKQHPEQAGKAVLAEHEVVFLRDGAIPDNLRSFNSRAGFFAVRACSQRGNLRAGSA